MSKNLVQVDTTKFCDLEVTECPGVPTALVCGEGVPCTYASIPPGYAVYEVKEVIRSESESAIMALSLMVAVLALALCTWYRSKAVPEKGADGPIHWSAWVVSGLILINTALVVWSLIVTYAS